MTQLTVDQLSARLAPVGVTDVRPLTGGASSLTFSGQWEGRTVVVKVAPPGLEPVLHRDVLRQARLMRALVATSVPVPEVLYEDKGSPPEIPPLFLMAYVEGSSVEPLFDFEVDAGQEGPIVAIRMRNAARVMAQLHRVDPSAVLGGEQPVVGLEAEIDRWCRLLETVDPGLAPGWEEASEALRACMPEPLPPAIVHGDFRLGNLLSAGPEVRAIIDWEVWTVGDPRVDVGWFLANADPETYRRETPLATSMPTAADLAAVYAESMGGEIPALHWFQALASFKSAATWSLIVKHNRRRNEPDPQLEAMAAVLPRLLGRARALIA